MAWDFDHVGIIEAEAATAGADAELAAIEASAQDVEPGDRRRRTMLFWTDPTDLDLVSRALPAQGFGVLSGQAGLPAQDPVDAASLSAPRPWKRSKPSWPRSMTTRGHAERFRWPECLTSTRRRRRSSSSSMCAPA